MLDLNLPIIETIPAISFHEAKIKIAEAHNRPVKDWEDFEPEEEKLYQRLFLKKLEVNSFL